MDKKNRGGNDKMTCPECKSETGSQIVTKGSRAIRMNIFCKNMNCKWEMDKRLKATQI